MQSMIFPVVTRRKRETYVAWWERDLSYAGFRTLQVSISLIYLHIINALKDDVSVYVVGECLVSDLHVN
jgi:hypothetical protein